jgi:adenylate cyclase
MPFMSEQELFAELLEGLEGEERDGRERLLAELIDDGVPADELRSAVAEGRLALLPLERKLAGPERYTAAEVAERAGVDPELLLRQWRALGMPDVDDDDAAFTADDVEAAERLRGMVEAGVDADTLIELGRLMAIAMSQFAAAGRGVATQLSAGDPTEYEVAKRYESFADSLIPTVGPALEYAYRLQLREQLRYIAIEAGGEGASEATEMSIAFADLVGFTSLGERLPPEELGPITGRLDELAREVAGGPVRLVKLIGDAAMFASPDTGALLEAMLQLVESSGTGDEEREEDEFPLLRAGIARGAVLPRGGDFYGRPVNLASRITAVARPGSVLVTEEVRAGADAELHFSDAGQKRLKGVDGSLQLYRARVEDEEDEPGSEGEGEGESARERRGSRRRRARRSGRRRP